MAQEFLIGHRVKITADNTYNRKDKVGVVNKVRSGSGNLNRGISGIAA